MSGTFWRTCPEIFSNLEERLNTTRKAKVSCQTNEKDRESDFILVIMTPLMIRRHREVYFVKVNCTFVITFYQQPANFLFFLKFKCNCIPYKGILFTIL